MPNFHKFTIKAQESLQRAQEAAAQKGSGELRAVHLLASLLEDAQTLIIPTLEKAGVSVDALMDETYAAMDRLPKSNTGGNVGQLYLAQELIRILDQAGKEAAAQKDEFVSCEHLLLGLLDISSEAQVILGNFGVKKETI